MSIFITFHVAKLSWIRLHVTLCLSRDYSISNLPNDRRFVCLVSTNCVVFILVPTLVAVPSRLKSKNRHEPTNKESIPMTIGFVFVELVLAHHVQIHPVGWKKYNVAG